MSKNYRAYELSPDGMQRALKESGFRQKDLADLWEKTEGTVSGKLSGRLPITTREVQLFCDLVGAKGLIVREVVA